MKTFSLFSVLSLTAATVFGSPQPLEGFPGDYTLGNLTWEGNVTDNGPLMSFSGPSFHDIESQILQANPGFTWPDQGTTNSPALKKVDHMTCDPNNIWWAQIFRIEEGIDYLKGKTGRCYIGPGPRFCSRLSCSYHSAIYWCNDQDQAVWIDCDRWTSYAQMIVDQCSVEDSSQTVRGQVFDTDNWNIMVGYGDC
ncbi:hypothetical protein F4819DRAFT_506214 [Hypoxylon fuscum]|nr:hypothetical protein F4819DRAFT_506214 [Hypoxylon fuscum]